MRGDSPQWSIRPKHGKGLDCVSVKFFHGALPLGPLTLTPEDGGEGTGGRPPLSDCTLIGPEATGETGFVA